jgi:two-component system, LytTR family, response regulator
MTCIALDDEPLALVLIEKFAHEIDGVQLVATFTDAAAAAQYLQNNTVDLLISDINMPDISGLQFVRDLPDERPMIIFLTAYKEHAHEGFDLDVVDYLIKPVGAERFEKAIKKAAALLDLHQQRSDKAPQPTADPFFFIFSDYQQIKITVADILYMEGMGDYVKIHLVNQKRPVLTLERLKNFAAKLENQGFKRIHRSFLVNVAKIEAKQKSQVRIANTWLPIGETYMQNVFPGF